MKRTPMRRTGFKQKKRLECVWCKAGIGPHRHVYKWKRGKRLSPVSKKTRTVRWPALKALRAHVLARAKGRCEFCGGGGLLDIHHVVRRSAKRDDTPDNAVALDRVCHRLTENPFDIGRLVITPLGNEAFAMRMVYATDKWAARG